MAKLIPAFLRRRHGLDSYSIDELHRSRIRIRHNDIFLTNRLGVAQTEKDALLRRAAEASTQRERRARVRDAGKKNVEVNDFRVELARNDQHQIVVDELIRVKQDPSVADEVFLQDLSGEELAGAIEDKAVNSALESERISRLVALAEGRSNSLDEINTAASETEDELVRILGDAHEAAAAAGSFEASDDAIEVGLATARKILSVESSQDLAD